MTARMTPLVLALLAGSLCLALRPRAQDAALAAETYEDTYHLPPPAWLRLFSLGHREALADALWCRALVYQGEEFAHEGSMRHVFRFAEAIETLDPDRQSLYAWIGTAGVYRPDAVTVDEVNTAITFLERGRERFPQDGELAWILGATLTFELPPLLPQEQRDDARSRGLVHLMDAARLGAAPEWMVLANTSLMARLGRAETATGHLEEMYATVSDETVREEIRRRIADIRSDAYGEAFVEANDRLERQRLRGHAYVSPDLFLLLAPTDDEGDLWTPEGLRAHVLDDLDLADVSPADERE